MADSDSDPNARPAAPASAPDQHDNNDNVPAWQRPTDAEATDATAATAETASAQDLVETREEEEEKLSMAKRFLGDEHVKTASRDRKMEFLKGKGFSDADVQKVLDEVGDVHSSEVKVSLMETYSIPSMSR
jgi:hypothetical protein